MKKAVYDRCDHGPIGPIISVGSQLFHGVVRDFIISFTGTLQGGDTSLKCTCLFDG